MKKEYCVHFYPKGGEMIEFEDIHAKSPREAEMIAQQRYCELTIESREIMRVCHCDKDQATDNDSDNITCDNCDKPL